MSFHPNHATTCDQCELAGPDRVGLTVARDDQPHAAEHGFCSIGCLLTYVRDHYLVWLEDHYLAQALAASPSPGRRSAVDGRGGDTGGAQGRRPLGSAGTVQAPPTSDGLEWAWP